MKKTVECEHSDAISKDTSTYSGIETEVAVIDVETPSPAQSVALSTMLEDETSCSCQTLFTRK